MNYYGIIGFVVICLASIGAYIPQFYNIIHYRSVEGISEMSLLINNMGLMCLTMNSIIFSWKFFFCRCFTDLFPFMQIALSWIMILIYYILFIIYKFQKKKKKRILSRLHYLFSYLFFAIFVVALALGEKLDGNNSKFFITFANILGYTSAILNSLVYIPQIYTLLVNKNNGNLSLITYLMQTPGNIFIIIFQAVIYKQTISTWITYVITFIEQSLILLIMTYYYFHPIYIEESLDEF